MFVMHKYHDKTVFIIGGSSGIGLAAACQFAEIGAHVHIFARREDILKEAQQQILNSAKKYNSVVHCTPLDVTDDIQTDAVLSHAALHTGTPDIVINCAGAAFPNYFEQISAEQFLNTLKLNVLGTRNVAAAAIPLLKKTRGQLVNTSSIAGFIGVFGYTDYSASKFAIVGFSEALQQEVEQYGINIAVLYPPDTYTAGFEEEEKTKPQETRVISENNTPMQPEQVASALLSALPHRPFHILPGLDNKLTHVLKRWCPWLVNWVMMRSIKKAQKSHTQ